MKTLIFSGFLEKSKFGTGGGGNKKPIYRGIALKGDLGSFQILRGLGKQEGDDF